MLRARAALACALVAAAAAAAADDPRAPVPAIEGVATVGAADFVPDPETGLRVARIAFPDGPSRRRLLRARPGRSVTGRLLAEMLRKGAAGNHGDLYDNRDRGHSTLRPARHPRLTFVAYDDSARAAGLDYGLNLGVAFDAITFGNSSTALTAGPFWRSQARAALTTAEGPARLSALYRANHLYVYPEHRDHDPERGDVYPAATPQIVISQGSSGSDRPFLRAIAAILAAFKPDTKAVLAERGLIAPTVQMILRRGMAGVESEADYLSPRAHPTVFDGEAIDLPRMLRRANALRPEDAPPAPRLRVVEEARPRPRVALFGDGLSETFFDTPDAVARIAHGVQGVRRYRLSVADTEPLDGRDLRFHWRVLRGPAVSVTPQDAEGREAEVIAPWTRPYAVPVRPDLSTHRIDVAVFADNGVALSAPAIFSVAFPPRQTRSYDVSGRPVEIDYAGDADAYADPALFPRRGWRDRYRYDGAGQLLGWTRTRADGSTDAYTRHGLRVIDRDAEGRPRRAEAVAYPVSRKAEGLVVAERPLGRVFAYRYASPADRLGSPIEISGAAAP